MTNEQWLNSLNTTNKAFEILNIYHKSKQVSHYTYDYMSKYETPLPTVENIIKWLKEEKK